MLILAALTVVGGGFALTRLPIDAVPDVTNVQVHALTKAPAPAPAEMEQVVTYRARRDDPGGARGGAPAGLRDRRHHPPRRPRQTPVQLLESLTEDVAYAPWVFTIPKKLRPPFLRMRELRGVLARLASETVRELTSVVAGYTSPMPPTPIGSWTPERPSTLGPQRRSGRATS